MGPDRSPTSRRSYLAALATGLAGLAGCGSSSGSGGETSSPTASPTAVPTTARADAMTSTETPTETTTEPANDTATVSAEVKAMEEAISTVEFSGTYFDTHAHWMNARSDFVSEYAGYMQTHDIGATVLFSPSQTALSSYESFLTTLTDPGVEFLPFMSAPPPNMRFRAGEFETLYEKAAPAFFWIGEWKIRDNPPAFTDPPLAGIWEVAGELGLPVMYHPFPQQEGTIEPAIKKYSETTFLLHGYQMQAMGEPTEYQRTGDLMFRLLENYDNVYWQADVASMSGGALFQYEAAGPFIDWYDSKAQRRIDSYAGILEDLMAAAPDQVLWGTDVAFEWHMHDGVMERVMEFTDRVTQGLSTEHREAYLRGNARSLFGL